MPFYIGGVALNGIVFLAPMAGVTDLPFRCLCRKFGASLAYTEMVSAKALSYGNDKTMGYLNAEGEEKPAALQLFGSDPGLIAEAAARYGGNFDIIDINMGCPAPKIVRNGEGAALLKNPVLIGGIVRRAASSAGKPVTVKIRLGFDRGSASAAYIALTAEQNGAAAVTVHGRYATERYSGSADWGAIGEVKRSVAIPVIGNGDIGSAEDAAGMIARSGCDAVMIGRAACGDPWLFSRINARLNDMPEPPMPTINEKIETALAHAAEQKRVKGERAAANEMKKHFAWYIKGENNSSRHRAAIMSAETLDEMEAVMASVRV